MTAMTSAYETWANEDSVTEILIRRIKQLGAYRKGDEEWMAISTAIDYAMKTTLKDSPDKLNEIRKVLSEIGYVPLRTSSTPSLRLGELVLSPDGVIGVNHADSPRQSKIDGAFVYDHILDVFTTGNCRPIFSIFLEGKGPDCIFSISPDSTKIAIHCSNQLWIWQISDCRIIYRNGVHLDKEDFIKLFWSGNSKKLFVVTPHKASSIDMDTEEIDDFSMFVGKYHQVVTNLDGSVLVTPSHGMINYSTLNEPFNHIKYDGPSLEDYPYRMIYAQGKFWILVEGQIYSINPDKVEYVGDYDEDLIDIDPNRFSTIMMDYTKQDHDEKWSPLTHCSLKRDGMFVEALTLGGNDMTHVCWISIEDLSCRKTLEYREGWHDVFDENRYDQEEPEPLNETYSYIIRSQGRSGIGQVYFIRGQEEIPMGPARTDAQALDVNGKIYLHRGRTIDIYDSETLEHLKSILAMDTEKWYYSGTDANGTISLVKIEDVKADSEHGSTAKILFGRMKAPRFKLDVFEGCSITVNKVWNLKFSIAIRDQIVWYYNRDGDRVKPVSLHRLKLKSDNMMRSSTYKSDESKYDVNIAELDNDRIALLSMDKLENNPNADIGATMRILDCNDGTSLNYFDLHKFGYEGDKHIEISTVLDVRRMVADGEEYVLAQFYSNVGNLVCSRSVKSGTQYPEGTQYLKGIIISCKGEVCTIMDHEKTSSKCYDAKLNPVDEEPDELPDVPKKVPRGGEIPFNKQWKLSFGTICQNNGAFFCLKNTE